MLRCKGEAGLSNWVVRIGNPSAGEKGVEKRRDTEIGRPLGGIEAVCGEADHVEENGRSMGRKGG